LTASWQLVIGQEYVVVTPQYYWTHLGTITNTAGERFTATAVEPQPSTGVAREVVNVRAYEIIEGGQYTIISLGGDTTDFQAIGA
ncbi:hypothetical protein LXA55_18260, partial [Erwinia amylovora]|uniref:hypothetical protein n=1 Tax=Erwinia amylovora TaxID=552 RepID=UPI0020BEBF81